jgi:hypothetical protein
MSSPATGRIASSKRRCGRPRRRERLAEDADLVTWLALASFAGTDYDRFAYELARYGHAVM